MLAGKYDNRKQKQTDVRRMIRKHTHTQSITDRWIYILNATRRRESVKENKREKGITRNDTPPYNEVNTCKTNKNNGNRL